MRQLLNWQASIQRNPPHAEDTSFGEVLAQFGADRIIRNSAGIGVEHPWLYFTLPCFWRRRFNGGLLFSRKLICWKKRFAEGQVEMHRSRNRMSGTVNRLISHGEQGFRRNFRPRTARIEKPTNVRAEQLGLVNGLVSSSVLEFRRAVGRKNQQGQVFNRSLDHC